MGVLDDDAGLLIGLLELLRGTMLLFLEKTVKIGEVVESASVADLRNGLLGIDQHTGGITNAAVGQVFRERFPGT